MNDDSERARSVVANARTTFKVFGWLGLLGCWLTSLIGLFTAGSDAAAGSLGVFLLLLIVGVLHLALFSALAGMAEGLGALLSRQPADQGNP